VVHCIDEPKQLSKRLLAAKKSAQEAVLKSVLSKEGKFWAEFYRYVKSVNEMGKIFLPLKVCNGLITPDSI
jgi:2-keto-4-pentenoate hydratase/2-oxohepta-3-ene-1,7-dioic acid hydratase in catechol pathway